MHEGEKLRDNEKAISALEQKLLRELQQQQLGNDRGLVGVQAQVHEQQARSAVCFERRVQSSNAWNARETNACNHSIAHDATALVHLFETGGKIRINDSIFCDES